MLERTQALCKSFQAKNQIKMKFLQHFLSSCVVFICACLYLCVSSASLEYTTDRKSCNTISEFKGTDFGRRRRFLLRRFCILQIMGPRSHLDSMWSQFARDTSDKAKEPRRVACAKDMENIKEELHTRPWHIELLRECTQGWFRSNQQRTLTNWVVSLRTLHGEWSEIWIPPKCYAASWVENNFLWPRRFMTLLEIHLQQDCKCCAAALGVAIWATIGPNNQNSLEETFWHLATTTSTPAPVWWAKTSAAPKTSKTTTAWWLVSNRNSMPLAMKRQINDQKKQSFPNTNLDRPGKTGTTSRLHFSAMHKLYWRRFLIMVASDCPTVMILVRSYLL